MKSAPVQKIEPASRAAANAQSKSLNNRSIPSKFVDNRPQTIAQRHFIDSVNQSAEAQRKAFTATRSGNSPAPVPLQETSTAQLRLVRYNRRDNALDAYLNALDGLLQAAATWALDIDKVPDGESGYYDRWKGLSIEYLDTQENTPFLAAAFGYAVETRTNAQLGTIAGNLPAGWTVDKQVTKGMTRPDIIVSDNLGAEVAWLDMTSDSAHSVGHVKKKAGGGWNNKPYVYEIVYPPLDKDLISQSGPPWQAAKVRAAKNANIKARKTATGVLRLALTNIIIKYGLSRDSSAPADAMKAFKEQYPEEKFSHDIIRSIIEMADEDIRDYGYTGRRDKDGRNKAAAESFLAREFFFDT